MAHVPTRRVVRGGFVVDGTGIEARRADVHIEADRIAAIETDMEPFDADVVDAEGLVVAPGFINVLSHAWRTLHRDPTGASDLVQGVTTEVFGEGVSLGPSDDRMPEWLREAGGAAYADRAAAARLSEGMSWLEGTGISPNIASFVGGHNLRILGAGFDDHPLGESELDLLTGLLKEEMQDGALGLGTALIYPPGSFARPEELVSLVEVVAEFDGVYISHLRSEGDRLLDALEELTDICRRTGCRGEVYHLKAAGRDNWPKMAQAIEHIESARRVGLTLTANMYPYTAGSTDLVACVPPRYAAGGLRTLLTRLADPFQRAEIAAAIHEPGGDYENLYAAAGGGRGIRILRDLPGISAAGRTLAELAHSFARDEVELLLELIERQPDTSAAFFMMDEANVRLGLSMPWVSIGSDAEAHRAIAPFTEEVTHPRAYGTFARVLGRYCREARAMSLEDAVRRMTSLPADNLGFVGRGRVAPGYYADLVVFDPAQVRDVATFDNPHAYALGVRHVLVNGVPVVRDGELTDARPGRWLRRARR